MAKKPAIPEVQFSKFTPTHALSEILRAVNDLTRLAEFYELAGQSVDHAIAKAGAYHLRMLARDFVRNGHITEDEWDLALDAASSGRVEPWTDTGPFDVVED